VGPENTLDFLSRVSVSPDEQIENLRNKLLFAFNGSDDDTFFKNNHALFFTSGKQQFAGDFLLGEQIKNVGKNEFPQRTFKNQAVLLY
jgi:hypothetical protein